MNNNKLKKLIAITCSVFISHAVSVSAIEWNTNNGRAPHAKPFLEVYGQSLPPIGYVNFCNQYINECRERIGSNRRSSINNGKWEELTRINRYVNKIITPVTDQELYNVPELWVYPTTRGDCEDYVLLKKRYLIDLGWPPESLLITVVLDENGSGHAVLTVTTTQGDFVLDNKNNEVLPWSNTNYVFVKRQSHTSPKIWVALDPKFVSRNERKKVSANIKNILNKNK